VSKSIILPYNYRSITLYLFILLFAVTILQSSSILSPTEIKTHVAKTTTTSPQQASKNNNNNNNHLAAVSSHLISDKIKTATPPSTTMSTANSNNNSSSIHKTVISKASVINPIKNSDSSSSNNNQQVSLPLSNKDNNNKDYQHYNPAIVNLTQKFNPSTISSSSPIRFTQLPSSYSSSFEKHISGKNPTMTITPRNLSTVVNDNYNHPTNVHNSIPTNNHLASVSSHLISDKIKTTTPTTPTTMSSTNLPSSYSSSFSIPSKNPNQILYHYYESLRISTQQQLQLQQQQQQQGQQLNSITNSNFNSDPIPIKILTANAGPDQKVKEGKKVTLHGTASDDSSSSSNTDDQLNFLWKQISGKSVKLHHEDTAKAKFNAPHVKKTTKLKFQLTVYDDNGNISSDTVKIIVKSHKHSHIDKHKHHD
jgi:K319L-like, PKD domain